MKTFKDLVFVRMPYTENKKIAEIDFDNGYSLEVVRNPNGLYSVTAYLPSAIFGEKETHELHDVNEKEVSDFMLKFQSVSAFGEPQSKREKVSSSKEAKNDRIDGKVRWELMPLDLLNEVAKVYTSGAEKYGANTWQDLENGYERYKGALLRHLVANDTEDFDSETGVFHLAAVAWNALSMLHFKMNRK